MRFTVRVHMGNGNVIPFYHTNQRHNAIQKESELKKVYGDDNVWIAESIQEILVG